MKWKNRKLPPDVLAFFGDATCIPHFPRATDNCHAGMRSMPWSHAQKLRSVELNPPGQLHWLLFDCDHDDPELWRAVGLPEPSFITVNPLTGRHHVVYRLKAPVCRSERGRARPLAYLRAVLEGLRVALNADPGYVRVLTKNPLHPAWRTVRPAEMPRYSLAELAANVDLRSARKSMAARARLQSAANLGEVGIGDRNRALFDAVRKWARANADDLANILPFAERCNEQLQQPLAFNEVKNTVSSIERYMASNGPLGHSRAEFRARQAARGRLGGRPSTTQASQPWVEDGVGRSTWYRREQASNLQQSADATAKRSGRPVTTKLLQPWLAEGISRATWYRRRKTEEHRHH